MVKFGKWIGAGFGWALFGGPIGALIGFGLGSFIDATQVESYPVKNGTTKGDFILSLLVLVAAVMKADGKVMRSELEYVKQYFIRAFGVDAASEAIMMLRDLLNQNIPLQDISNQIRSRMDYASRLELLHLLYGIANADGILESNEVKTIEKIAEYMDISMTDMLSIKSMFIKDDSAYYKILGIEPSASFDEVKKAYRLMAVNYHPDKVAYLGEDVKKQAEEKFRKINEAYDFIKKQRGVK